MAGAGWERWVPMLGWLPAYRRAWLPADALAGAVVAALVIPQALGYAVIARVPVQVGLYAVPAALVAYAVFGSSRQLVVGPVSTVSVLSGSIVAASAHGDAGLAVALTAALAVCGGVMLVAAGLLRFGWMAEFLSKPIITGFVFGLTLTIVIGELPSLLGVPSGGSTVPSRLGHLAAVLGRTNATTTLVAAASLAVLFVGGRVAPRVPWGLIVLVAGVVGSQVLDLAGRGVKVVGAVPQGVPPLGVPVVPSDLVGDLVIGGGAVAMVGLAEGLSAARLFATRNGYRVDSDREFVAAGASNVAAGLSGGLGVAGSLSKTAAADRAGGRTQVAGLVTAAIVVLTLVTVAGLLAPLPKAVLSAIVVHAVWGLMDVAAMRRYAKVRRNDIVAALVALVGVLVFGVLYGLVAAVALSVLGLVYRSGRMDVEVMGKVPHEKAAWGSTRQHPERKAVPGLCVMRLNSPLFWVNAAQAHDLVLTALEEHPGTRVVMLDLEGTNQIDTTAADMLADLLTDLRERGVDLMLVRVFFAVRRVLRRTGFEADLGPDRMWHSISQGVRAAKALYPEAFGQQAAQVETDVAETDAAGPDAAGPDAAEPDAAEPDDADERIAVGREPVMIHGLTAGYEDDPPVRGPRWWHRGGGAAGR